MDLITSNPVLYETAGGDEASKAKDLSIELLKEQLAVDGGRKRTVSKSRSTTSSTNQRNAVSWPEFKIPVPDPELGKWRAPTFPFPTSISHYYNGSSKLF